MSLKTKRKNRSGSCRQLLLFALRGVTRLPEGIGAANLGSPRRAPAIINHNRKYARTYMHGFINRAVRDGR